MRIERVTFRNFRAYRGRAEVMFPKPTGRTGPVYLLGGENGAGKTSFLMALGFALYGIDSDGISYRPGRRDRRAAYEAALAESFNRHARGAGDNTMGVSVEVGYTGSRFEVQRDWWFKDGRVVDEDVRVRIDGAPPVNADHDLTSFEGRSEVVSLLTQVMLPAHAARFFFFDGEEVASLAERDLGKSVISGLDGLLGLDAITALASELSRVERRERERIRAAHESSEYDEARSQHEVAEEGLASARTALEQALVALETLRKRHAAIIDELTRLFDGRAIAGVEELRAELDLYRAEYDEAGRDFSRALGDSLGAIVSHDVLLDLQSRVNATLEHRRDAAVSGLAGRRAGELTERLLRKRLTPPLTAEQRAQLRRHLVELVASETMGAPAEGDPLDAFGDGELARLAGRLGPNAGAAFGDLRELAKWRRELKERIAQVEGHLRRFEQSSVPAQLIERREQEAEGIRAQEAAVELLDVEAHAAEEHAKETHRALLAAEEELTGSEMSRARIDIARRSRRALEQFRGELRVRRVGDLEKEVARTLRQLLHREGALERAEIDAQASTVTLYDGRGEEIPVPSAGEREVFALSLIHGLGQLSHKNAPLVIDTPLGRLDNAHRRAIVADFLPSASHQVIVLSTDSEIDAELYDVLRPHLAWQATIRSTPDGAVIEPGTYFDREKL